MASSAPLVILFDQPLGRAKQRLQSLVDGSVDLMIEMSSDQSLLCAKLQQGSIGFDVTWSEEQPVWTGFRSVFFDTPALEKSTLLSIDLSENLTGGERVAPIAMALLVFGARIAKELSATAVMWNPAKIISDSAFFVENVENYAKGEVFPVLVTVDFDYEDGERILRSTGLSWFSGQEIELTGDGLKGQELVRRAIRLVHDIGANGPVMTHQLVPDLDADKLIELTPTAAGNVLFCKIRSKTDATIQVTSVH